MKLFELMTVRGADIETKHGDAKIISPPDEEHPRQYFVLLKNGHRMWVPFEDVIKFKEHWKTTINRELHHAHHVQENEDK